MRTPSTYLFLLSYLDLLRYSLCPLHPVKYHLSQISMLLLSYPSSLEQCVLAYTPAKCFLHFETWFKKHIAKSFLMLPSHSTQDCVLSVRCPFYTPQISLLVPLLFKCSICLQIFIPLPYPKLFIIKEFYWPLYFWDRAQCLECNRHKRSEKHMENSHVAPDET